MIIQPIIGYLRRVCCFVRYYKRKTQSNYSLFWSVWMVQISSLKFHFQTIVWLVTCPSEKYGSVLSNWGEEPSLPPPISGKVVIELHCNGVLSSQLLINLFADEYITVVFFLLISVTFSGFCGRIRHPTVLPWSKKLRQQKPGAFKCLLLPRPTKLSTIWTVRHIRLPTGR